MLITKEKIESEGRDAPNLQETMRKFHSWATPAGAEFTVLAGQQRDLVTIMEDIANGRYHCDRCGVTYVNDYEGPCMEPGPDAEWYAGAWTQVCPGTVSAAGTARWALRQ